MKAMILAAGRGERMRPLTDHTPKPLLKAAGKTLIEYALENLAAAGFSEIVINIAHLGNQIKDYCGNGERWNVSIAYSDEGDTALETAGGIVKALPLLGDKPFLVLNADIVCDYPLANLRAKAIDLAHLVMINNPSHHPEGDFSLNTSGLLSEQGSDKLTFSGIGVYHPKLFENIPATPLKLKPVLNRGMQLQRISGEKFSGLWMDIGTPERLRTLAELGNHHARETSRHKEDVTN
ncbi:MULTISPECIES: N-acetylmuramate alpha-1-phosphate uridylyltransferase MurU [Methylomonas]|uniref:Mannose-1-phosphate guanylyltransferase n=2 Tax=Methylomonas TaxID=416 RepID=A0A126T0U0_9GAMM|nr:MULTISPECIES: nucleotidyltransferase family protein [Methylomonas]AMK75703.1 mannose-1-phosphate guanylyltransferase [Methylomonas denitrificans]OAH98303.1 mannose-1-phosphate guanylyltransferase [Methylomonas methanica]TCV82471.1 MurNAc alpha-1-phosphate uridylyltransferase [Methylomonas methanica]